MPEPASPSPVAPRAVALDLVRAVAIVLVVLLHTAGVVANPGGRRRGLLGGQHLRQRHPRRGTLVRALAASSYGIYLLHPLLLDVLGSGVLGVRISGTSLPPFVGIPALAAGVLLVSLAVMMMARRVPVVGRLLGA